LPTIDKDDYDLIDPAVGFKSIPCYYIVGGDGGDRFRLNTFTHELTTTQSLDRELKDNYTLIVQATNDCFKVPPNITHFDHKDNSLLHVLIGVRDVNDNSPKMIKKVFTGGFTTDIDFGTVLMEVKAVDKDMGANSVVNYYIISEVRQTLTEGLDTLSAEPFAINRITGEISLNFDPQKDMKGYFEFDVLANDTDGLADSARVFVCISSDH
jgi:cadherin 23